MRRLQSPGIASRLYQVSGLGSYYRSMAGSLLLQISLRLEDAAQLYISAMLRVKHQTVILHRDQGYSVWESPNYNYSMPLLTCSLRSSHTFFPEQEHTILSLSQTPALRAMTPTIVSGSSL